MSYFVCFKVLEANYLMDKLLFAACFILEIIMPDAEKPSRLNICLEQTFWIFAVNHAKIKIFVCSRGRIINFLPITVRTLRVET